MRQTLHFMQWVAVTFILVLGAVMVHDGYQSRRALQSGEAELSRLKEGDLSDPRLAQTVRDLDFAYRSVYFQGQDRRRVGFLLLGIAFLGYGLLKGVEVFYLPPELKIPEPVSSTPEQERRQLLATAGCVAVVLLGGAAALRRALPPAAKPAAVKTVAKPTAEARAPEEKIEVAAAMEAETHQWAQFRGSVLPNRNVLPRNWDFQVKWRAQIPLPGFNSPVLWDDSLFVGGGDPTDRMVFCYDSQTGELRWKTPCGKVDKYPEVTEDVGASAPTLCVDAQRIYAVFATGEVLCCRHDGSVAWRRQLPFPDISYGYASSPLLLGDRLIVQYDLHKTQTLYALNVLDGSTLWKTERKAASSWASPLGLLRSGKPAVFTVGCKVAELFDAATGRSFWRQECLGGEVAATPFTDGRALYFSNTGAFTGAFALEDGKILYQNENVPAPEVCSSIVCGNVFLLFTGGSSVIALDAKSGEEKYEKEFDNGFYASPVLLQGKLVAVNLDGELMRMAADDKDLTVEAKYSIGKKVVAMPAFRNGRLVVRTFDNELICLEAKP